MILDWFKPTPICALHSAIPWFLSELIIESLESSNTSTALCTEAQIEIATAESQKLGSGELSCHLFLSLTTNYSPDMLFPLLPMRNYFIINKEFIIRKFFLTFSQIIVYDSFFFPPWCNHISLSALKSPCSANRKSLSQGKMVLKGKNRLDCFINYKEWTGD